MLKGTNNHQDTESPIFDDLSLYKVVITKDSKPLMIHNNGGVSVIIPFFGINNTSFDESQFESMFKGILVLYNLSRGLCRSN
jgi:hypothetical protein